jgi:DNA polymerase-1
MPPIVTSKKELEYIVHEVTNYGAFAYDIESRGVLDRHPDLYVHLENDFKQHVSELKNKSPEILLRARSIIEERYQEAITLNPLRNEVFWIGIATHGKSWAIPMGHSVGYIVEPEEIGDGATVPPPGYRRLLKNGTESLAKARYVKPAKYAEPPTQLSRSEVFETLRPIFFSDIIKIGHNVKFDTRSISKYYGEIPPGPYMDTMILQHITNENLMSYSLENLISHNYGGLRAYEKGGKLGEKVATAAIDAAALYVHRDVRWTWMLFTRLMKKVESQPDLRKALNLDCQVLEVLMSMENLGIPIDVKNLKDLNLELDNELHSVLDNIHKYAPKGFNPDSNKHKQTLLFTPKSEGGLGLKPTKKTASGAPSVDEEALRAVSHKHEVVADLLKWAELQKLKTTYVEGLLPKLRNGRLHPSFHLHRTATGRLSSSDPNLQNIPRTSSIRKLFIAPENKVLLVADYDQIELRVMAMFSQDPRLLEVFKNEEDIHAATASAVFKKPIDKVTTEERQIGKGVNFLTAYGGGSAKLARVTGISERDAQEILANYYKSFKTLTQWKQQIVNQGTSKGYVSTLQGRRRRLPDLRSTDQSLKSRAERQAVNAVVQGTAADICKQAMINVYKIEKQFNLELIVQVHDELVIAAPENETKNLIQPFLTAMGDGSVIDSVPIKVSYQIAHSWAEAKE